MVLGYKISESNHEQLIYKNQPVTSRFISPHLPKKKISEQMSLNESNIHRSSNSSIISIQYDFKIFFQSTISIF